MRQDFKIAICWKDVGNPNLLKEWSLNPSKYEILCAITFASVTWPPCCCTSLQTHISWLDRPCHLCKSQSRRDLNQFILPASSWHWTPLTSSSSYYLTTETPNINGGRPKGQFTIKSIHKAMYKSPEHYNFEAKEVFSFKSSSSVPFTVALCWVHNSQRCTEAKSNRSST